MIPAITGELKNEVFKLRYQVYCIENPFENPADFPDNMESDIFDSRSVHYLIRHRKSGDFAATTRLILPLANKPTELFPIELHSTIEHIDFLKSVPRINLAELSRFCVSKRFRQRKNERHLVATCGVDSNQSFTQREKWSSSYLTLALIACGVKLSAENNIDYWYALMEPSLQRLVSALGVPFDQIGPLVDYHGLRQPCLIKVDALLEGVAKKNIHYWNLLTNNGVNSLPDRNDQHPLEKLG